MILSALLLGLTPTVFFQEPEETKLEAAQRKVAELEAELGPEHLDLVEPLDAVLTIHYGQAQYGKAEEVCRHILSIREKSLGPDHPDVALALNNLGYFLNTQGSYAEARPLYERSLLIWEKTLGPDHPDVATSFNNLAALLDTQGFYAEARPLYEQGLRSTLNHLALNMGSMTETERFQYLKIQTGPEHLLLNLVTMRGEGPKEN